MKQLIYIFTIFTFVANSQTIRLDASCWFHAKQEAVHRISLKYPQSFLISNDGFNELLLSECIGDTSFYFGVNVKEVLFVESVFKVCGRTTIDLDIYNFDKECFQKSSYRFEKVYWYKTDQKEGLMIRNLCLKNEFDNLVEKSGFVQNIFVTHYNLLGCKTKVVENFSLENFLIYN